jgi:hypothetical protein
MEWGGSGVISGRLDSPRVWCRPRIATVPLVRDRLRSSTIFASMDSPYDSQHEVLPGSSLPVQGAPPPPSPFQAARIAFRRKRDAAPADGIKSFLVRPEPPAGRASSSAGEGVGRRPSSRTAGLRPRRAPTPSRTTRAWASGLAGSREARCRRRRARRRQRKLGRSGCRGLTSSGVVPLGEIQETTPGERISLLGHTSDPLGQTSVELLLHDTPPSTSRPRVECSAVAESRRTASAREPDQDFHPPA